jgi:hypothetical protein
MKNSKDCAVSNCDVLQTGNNASDHSHIKRVTPMVTKLKELADYKNGINETRQSRTTRLRRQNPDHVKPL